MTATDAKKPAAKRSRRSVPKAEPTTSTATAVDALAPAPSIGVREIAIALIDPHPANPRKELGDLTELTASIAQKGIRQNLLLVPHPDDPDRYLTVIGHRRVAAAATLGWTHVPAAIDATLDAKDQRELMLVENLQRRDLTLFEEADGYQGLLDLGESVTEIHERTGRARKTITDRVRLSALDQRVRPAVDNRELTLTEALALADIKDQAPDLYGGLLERLDAGTIPSWAIEQAQTTIKSRAEEKAVRKQLKDEGCKIAPKGTYTSLYTADKPLELKKLRIKPDAHRDCPGHAALLNTVNYNGKFSWSYICMQPAEHHPEEHDAAYRRENGQAPKKSETAEERAKREAKEQLDRDLAAATQARRSWIRTVMAVQPKGTTDARKALVEVASDYVLLHDRLRDVGVGMWLNPTNQDDSPMPTDPTHVLAYAVLAEVDSTVPERAHTYDWVNQYATPQRKSDVCHYLNVLDKAGYPLTDIEKQLVTIYTAKAKPEPVEDES